MENSLTTIKMVPLLSSHRCVSVVFNSDYCISSVYLPNRSGCTDIYNESLDYLNIIVNKFGRKAILLGDFNGDPSNSLGVFSSTANNEQGKILTNYLKHWSYT